MADKLSNTEIQQFITDGYVKLENAFPSQLAKRRFRFYGKTLIVTPSILLRTQPVIRLGEYGQEPFRKATNTSLLHTAFDQLVSGGSQILSAPFLYVSPGRTIKRYRVRRCKFPGRPS